VRDVSSETPITTIDLARYRRAGPEEQDAIAVRVDEACRSDGFFVIERHAVPDDVLSAAGRAAGDFFDLPDEDKRAGGQVPVLRGYRPPGAAASTGSIADTRPGDLGESYRCGPPEKPRRDSPGQHFDFLFGENCWPGKPDTFRNAWTSCYRHLESLGREIMQIVAAALGLPDAYFNSAFDHHCSLLQAVNYPDLGRKLPAGRQRAADFTHFGSVMILKPDGSAPGPEVRRRSGEWLPLPPLKDGLIVSVGDLLARWTNDRWVSVPHRLAAAGDRRRCQSLTFLQYPNPDACIECLPGCAAARRARYAPVLAGEFLRERMEPAAT